MCTWVQSDLAKRTSELAAEQARVAEAEGKLREATAQLAQLREAVQKREAGRGLKEAALLQRAAELEDNVQQVSSFGACVCVCVG